MVKSHAKTSAKTTKNRINKGLSDFNFFQTFRDSDCCFNRRSKQLKDMSEYTHNVKIKKIEQLTPDVKRYVVEKPEGYSFQPGQATEVSVKKEGWKEEGRPFTFTNLPEDDYLEFTIKSYPSHEGVTDKMDDLKEGDELIIGDSWGAITYKGPGVFIAGGAGVTPFISIFKKLEKEGELKKHKMIFSNHTAEDVILEDMWENWLGDNFIATLTNDDTKGYEHDFIDKSFLEEHVKDFNQHFYVCGPQGMVEDVSAKLKDLGAKPDSITFEQ